MRSSTPCPVLAALACALLLCALGGSTSSGAEEGGPPAPVASPLRAGYGSRDITPPAGTPSAGYGARMGTGMLGVHDPLLATALVLATGPRTLVLVAVDSLGFDRGMAEDVRAAARGIPGLEKVELHLGSSHTHAGGGAFMPQLPAAVLFGLYDPQRRREYVAGTIEAVRQAAAGLRPARLGVGYRMVEGLNRYRGKWPPRATVNPWLTLLKVEGADGRPLAALFVFAAHPTVLPAQNRQFSADFIGYARKGAAARIGSEVGCLYLNGAQADVSPAPPPAPEGRKDADRFAACERMGERLGEAVAALWKETESAERVLIETERISFVRPARPGSSGFTIATGDHPGEMNGIAIDRKHVFITVPGELSTIYDARIRQWAEWLGFRHATVLGLTDDAMGYIVTPEAYRHRTYESTISFGGPDLGPFVEEKAVELLHLLEPDGAFHGSRGRGPASPAEPLPAGSTAEKP